jgi:signal transduction histidine kinase
MNFDSLRVRLVASHLVVSLASILLIAIFAGSAIFNAARKEVETSLEDLAFAASNSLEAELSGLRQNVADPIVLRQALLHLLSNHPELTFVVYDLNGLPLAYSGDSPPPRADQTTAPDVINAIKNSGIESGSVSQTINGEDYLSVAARIQRGNETYGILRLSTPLTPALTKARQSLLFLVGVAALAVFAVGLFAYLLANNLAIPIEDLTQAASDVALGDLSVRVTPAGPAELLQLGDAFNIMAGRLEDNVDELRAFVANASHELRTPLTVVKLRTESLREGALQDQDVAARFIDDIEGEVDRLVRMVNDLLDLSRLEAGMVAMRRAPVNLGTLATDVYETFSIRAHKVNVDLTLDVEPEIPSLQGNEDQLRRAIVIFVDNAVKYTPDGGRVELFVRGGRKSKTVRVLVRDTGPGISNEHLAHLFERFYRAEATRPRTGSVRGSGLGLAIAKSIVEFHGGKIGVSSQLGKGSTFWMELPVTS